MFFVLRAGCPWKASKATGSWSSSTAHRRYQDWVEAGVFAQLCNAALPEYDVISLAWTWNGSPSMARRTKRH